MLNFSITALRWKIANAVPIHKNGDRGDPTNYRPVSLTSICCKFLEHIILGKINQEIEGKLHPNQHGFRQGLSCTTQLVTTMHGIMSEVDVGHIVHAAVLDFAKAFDKVSHALLIKKLVQIDVSPSIVNWIMSFLSDRKQRVVIEGQASE